MVLLGAVPQAAATGAAPNPAVVLGASVVGAAVGAAASPAPETAPAPVPRGKRTRAIRRPVTARQRAGGSGQHDDDDLSLLRSRGSSRDSGLRLGLGLGRSDALGWPPANASCPAADYLRPHPHRLRDPPPLSQDDACFKRLQKLPRRRPACTQWSAQLLTPHPQPQPQP